MRAGSEWEIAQDAAGIFEACSIRYVSLVKQSSMEKTKSFMRDDRQGNYLVRSRDRKLEDSQSPSR